MKPDILVCFKDYKEELTQKINDKKRKKGIDEELVLMEGFVQHVFSPHLTGSIHLTGKYVPIVMAVGRESGRVYYFALKVLIPNIGT